MRRQLLLEEQTKLLKSNYIGRLGYISNGSPYIVPITYFYDDRTDCIISYSGKGHKVSAMRKNPLVSLQIDEINSISEWKSILLHGTYEEMEGINAKHMLREFSQGIKAILSHISNTEVQAISEFSSKIHFDGNPIVFRINITEVTGKYRTSGS